MIARYMLSVAAGLVVLIPLSAQQLTPRDAFWSASDLISVTPNPATHKQAVPHPTPRHPVSDSSSGSASPTAVDSTQTPRLVKAALVSDNGYGAAPHVASAAANRLGLRCSLLLRGLDGRYVEVTPGSVFHSGDHIRLSLLANEPGYIYVIQQGSTGAWSPIFPSPGSAADSNKIPAGQIQLVPGGTRAFAFDQNPGDEKLYVILSHAPIADIDRAVQGLKGTSQPAPARNPSSSPATTNLIAENKIPDFFVQQLASRDLTLVDEQKVDDSSADASTGEKAIYVVSKANGADSSSQVVLNVELRHE